MDIFILKVIFSNPYKNIQDSREVSSRVCREGPEQIDLQVIQVMQVVIVRLLVHVVIANVSHITKCQRRYPGGESYEDIVARLEPVIMELER